MRLHLTQFSLRVNMCSSVKCMLLGYAEKKGSFQTVDDLQEYFCHGWCNTVATDPQLDVSWLPQWICSFHSIARLQPKGLSCCLQHFSFAECFINMSTAHLIIWETLSLNDHPRLQCYTTNIRSRTWQFHKVLMLLICLLSVLIFARL